MARLLHTATNDTDASMTVVLDGKRYEYFFDRDIFATVQQKFKEIGKHSEMRAFNYLKGKASSFRRLGGRNIGGT